MPPRKGINAVPLEADMGLNVFFTRQITDFPYVPKIPVHIAAKVY